LTAFINTCDPVNTTGMSHLKGKQTVIFLGTANRTGHNITAWTDISLSKFLNW